MKNVNANIDQMRDFALKTKRYKDQIGSNKRDILYKLRNLGDSWKDKAYQSYREEYEKGLNALIKKQEEFLDQKIKEIEDRANELEEFLNKMNRR